MSVSRACVSSLTAGLEINKWKRSVRKRESISGLEMQRRLGSEPRSVLAISISAATGLRQSKGVNGVRVRQPVLWDSRAEGWLVANANKIFSYIRVTHLLLKN